MMMRHGVATSFRDSYESDVVILKHFSVKLILRCRYPVNPRIKSGEGDDSVAGVNVIEKYRSANGHSVRSVVTFVVDCIRISVAPGTMRDMVEL